MKVSPVKLKEVLDKLAFDRSNVSDAEKYAEDIKSAVAIIDAEKDTPESVDVAQPEMAALYYQVTLWYLIHKRDEGAARFGKLYIATFKENEKRTAKYADALGLYGHALTIDPQYTGAEFFIEARDICVELLKTEVDPEKIKEIELILAFNLRYIGLKHHRDNEAKAAQENFIRSSDIYHKYANGQPDMGEAECQHLYGVSLTREGKYPEALLVLYAALKMEQDYVNNIRDHFMLATTKQSIADTNKRLAAQVEPGKAKELLEEGMTLLDEADEYQAKLFGDDKNKNADYAKTLQFKGDNFHARKMYLEAVQVYLQTIEVKAKANEKKGGFTHDMVIYTQNTLVKTLQAVNADANPQVLQAVKPLLDEKIKAFGVIFIGDIAKVELEILAQHCEKIKPAPEAIKSTSMASPGMSFGGFATVAKQPTTTAVAAAQKQAPTVSIEPGEEKVLSPRMPRIW